MDFHRGLPDDLRSLNGFGPVPFAPCINALDSGTMTPSHQQRRSSTAGDVQGQFDWPELFSFDVTLQHNIQANDENISHLKTESDFQDTDFMSIPTSSRYWSQSQSSSHPLLMGPSPVNLAHRSSPTDQHNLLTFQNQSLYHDSDGSSYGFLYAYPPQDTPSALDKDRILPDFSLNMGSPGGANDILWPELTSDAYLPLDSAAGAASLAYVPSGMFEARAVTASDIRFVESPASTCSSLYSSAPHTPLLMATSQAQAALPSSHLSPSPPNSLSSFHTSSSSRPTTPDTVILKRSPPSNRSAAGVGKICTHCKTTSTPLWRRDPHTREPLCNACGLYLLQRRKQRPQALIDADAAFAADEENGLALEAMGAPDDGTPMCCHCRTRNTSVWRRRSRDGAQLCNACGVYLRLRGKDRPLTLKSRRIRPRTKHAPAST